MNYGKKGAKKRTAELTSKSTVIKKKLHVTFFKALLLLFFVVVILGGSTAFGVWKGIIDSAPSIDELDATPTGYQTIVLDDEGNKISTLVASGSNRKYVTIDQIPQDLQDAFVALEDMRFYEHNGIDLKGIVRAAVNGVKNGFNFNQGASTITQQLLKNTVLSEVWAGEESFIDKVVRKVQEQYMAVELEKQVDKLWILENYLNAINLGQNTLGVAVASERYFGKPVSELTLSESAVIAAITQNPSKLNPISNPEKNAERREKTLNDMLEQGYITQEEYDEAMADNVYERIQIINIETGETVVNSYFIDELTDQVITDLIEQKGYTESQAYKALYQGGLTIKSTQNMAMQAICDEEVNNLANYPTDPKVSFSYRLSIQKADGTIKHYSEQTMLSYYQKLKGKNYNINFASQEAAQEAIDQYKADIMEEGDEILGGGETVTFTLQPQVALTIIDQETGEVKAIIGGRGDKTASKTLNRASDTTRQPGSTFKIIACYAAALDAGGLTLASVQNDAPFAYSGEESRLVSNYDNRYRGWTTLREAIISSLNVVTVKTYTQISPRLGHSYAVDFGFSTIRSDEADNQSFCLGGMTNGVSNLELTAAYATIANEGTYQKPRFYTQILDHDGNVLLDNSESETHTVLKKTTAYLLTDAMKDVMTAGTGTAAYFGSSMPQAGKSGTTTDNRDAVWAGYTPYYTCVVWGGYDDNAKQNGNQVAYPKKIWKAVMSRIHEDLEYKDFTKPDDVIRVAVCKESGLLPIPGVCDADPRGSAVISEYFASGTEPTEQCNHHILASYCDQSGTVAGSYCLWTTPGVAIIPDAVTGDSRQTEDAPYLLGYPCPVHEWDDPLYTGEYSYPVVPGTSTTTP